MVWREKVSKPDLGGLMHNQHRAVHFPSVAFRQNKRKSLLSGGSHVELSQAIGECENRSLGGNLAVFVLDSRKSLQNFRLEDVWVSFENVFRKLNFLVPEGQVQRIVASVFSADAQD